MKTTATHIQIRQTVHCRGLHLEAGAKHPVASLTADQLDDLLSNGFAVGCEAPDVAPEAAPKGEESAQKEAAEAAPAAESAVLSTRPRRRRPVVPDAK